MLNLRIDTPRERPLRVYLECYDTATNLLRTGIQRVVRNVVLHRDEAAKAVGVEALSASFIGDSFYPFSWRPTNDFHETGRFERLNRRIAAVLGERLGERWMTRMRVIGARARKALRFRKLRRRGKAFFLTHFGAALKPAPNDVLVLVDVTWGLNVWPAVRKWQAQGGKVAVVMYDILPITHANFVCESLGRRFASWFENVLVHADLILAISDTVRDQVQQIIATRNYAAGQMRPRVSSFRLGAELDMRHADAYVRPAVQAALAPAAGPAPYIMVGTVELRKNHHAVLDAFEQLWNRGSDARLFVIGRRGWERHEVERRMLNHPQYGQRLLWFPDMSDSELSCCYQQARGVVFASKGEGFGLPIVEGLQYGRPVFASDLAVHREVGGEFVAYFDPDRPEQLAALIEQLETHGRLPGVADPRDFRVVTWRESTTELLARCREAFDTTQPAEQRPARAAWQSRIA